MGLRSRGAWVAKLGMVCLLGCGVIGILIHTQVDHALLVPPTPAPTGVPTTATPTASPTTPKAFFDLQHTIQNLKLMVNTLLTREPPTAPPAPAEPPATAAPARTSETDPLRGCTALVTRSATVTVFWEMRPEVEATSYRIVAIPHPPNDEQPNEFYLTEHIQSYEVAKHSPAQYTVDKKNKGAMGLWRGRDYVFKVGLATRCLDCEYACYWQVSSYLLERSEDSGRKQMEAKWQADTGPSDPLVQHCLATIVMPRHCGCASLLWLRMRCFNYTVSPCLVALTNHHIH